MAYGEWCPQCGAEIVRVTRGIPSMGTCENGHTTDRRDVLRRKPAPRDGDSNDMIYRAYALGVHDQQASTEPLDPRKTFPMSGAAAPRDGVTVEHVKQAARVLVDECVRVTREAECPTAYERRILDIGLSCFYTLRALTEKGGESHD